MEKIPNIESVQPARFRTIERKILETLLSGESVEEVVECNGKEHRRCVDKITYSSDGDIEYVDQLSKEVLGACDHGHE